MDVNILQLQIEAHKHLQRGQYPEAIAIYEQCLEANPEEVTNYWYLGLVYLLLGDEETAETVWISVLWQGDRGENYIPELLKILDLEGKKQLQRGNLFLAQQIYQKIQDLLSNREDLDSGVYAYHLGLTLEQIGEKYQAIEAYQKAIGINPNLVDAYNNLGNIFLFLGELQQAEYIYRQAILTNPQHWGAYFNLFLVLSTLEDTEKSLKFASETSIKFPGSLLWKLKQHLTLPPIYSSVEEINFYRKNFTTGLAKIFSEVDFKNNYHQYLESLTKHNNFYLAYQGLNDLELQKKYGQLVHKIMVKNYPQWVTPLAESIVNQCDKIKLGYISNCFRDHTVGKLAIGWLKNHHQDKFEIYCYYLDSPIDSLTKEFQKYSNYFAHIPHNLEAVMQKIREDRLHILVFLDIGMYPEITQIASLRLAPVQCTTWLHPVTSGLPTIDYFLSSDLMEPENGQDHYSEKLIKLPHIGICYAQPELPEKSVKRSDFGLNNQSIIYLCPQFLPKYLPQYDYILAAIAQKVPQAKLVFISHNSKYITAKFQKRLGQEFSNLNLDLAEYCLFMPRLAKEKYLQLNLLSDIYLDSFSWSGGHTTLEAIACNLPVVTCPGEFMRGRHSYAIMKMLGVEDTIAKSESEYLEIAIKLGLEPQWRQQIKEQIKANHNFLYNDSSSVRALEKFYQNLVSKN